MCCVPVPPGDVWLIWGKESVCVSISECMHVCVSQQTFSHFSSASCSASPLILFSSRPKHPHYIIIILLTVVSLWKGTNNKASFWATVLREVHPHWHFNDTRTTSCQETFECKYIFLSDACCSECGLQQQYATIWERFFKYSIWTALCPESPSSAKHLKWGNPASNIEFVFVRKMN